MKRQRPSAIVRSAPGGDDGALLDGVLDAAGFWPLLDAVRSRSQSTFRIVIKPDLDIFDLAASTATDPALVQHLARRLREHGCDDIAVLDSRNEADGFLINREPLLVADLAGYDFYGEYYSISDDVPASEQWKQADFRINFAKNRTHETEHYALCAHNLLGVSDPEHRQGDATDRCMGVLRNASPHFNLIDAIVSFHGAAGHRAPLRHQSSTLIVSADALLADLVGASKMELDPYISPLNAGCLRTMGLPEDYRLDGDITPYALWQNVPPLLADSARRRDRAAELGRVSRAWFQTVDRESFPFREFHNDRINSYIAPLVARVG